MVNVVDGLKIQIHVCGTYVFSVWFTLLIGFGSVWIFSRIMNAERAYAVQKDFVRRCFVAEK